MNQDPTSPGLTSTPASPHVRTLVCTETYAAAREIDRSAVALILPDEFDLLWLDLEGPSNQELQAVADEFSFHPLAVEDATQEHQRAKIDQYDNFYFLVLFAVSYNPTTHQVDEDEIDFFLGSNYLVTAHEAPIHNLQRIASRLHVDLRTLDHGASALLYTLADTIVDAYLTVVEQIRERIQQLERRVFGSQLPHVRQGLHEDIFALGAELLQLRYVIGPERDVLAVLSRRGLRFLDKKTALYFRDVADHLQRVIETIDVYHDMLGSVLDSYNAQNSNSLNQVMRLLTSWSIILMSIAVIAGVYGMNFNTSVSPFNMPELDWYFGYPLALLAMAVLTIALVIVFKRRGWM